MNIKQFVENAGKEFDKQFPINADLSVAGQSQNIKDFYSTKLRELIGEVRSVLEKKKLLEVGVNPTALMWKQRFNNDIDELLHLLDEAGGKE